jgi:hypothetical protein
VAQVGLIDEKNRGTKISCYCPFNVYITKYSTHSNDIFLADFFGPARHAKFSPYENWLKTNVDTLSADFPYGDKILRCGEKFSRCNSTHQWKVPPNDQSGKTLFSKMFKKKTKNLTFKILQRMIRKFPAIL